MLEACNCDWTALRKGVGLKSVRSVLRIVAGKTKSGGGVERNQLVGSV